MNRLFLAVALALSLSTVALAKELALTGCTLDKQAVAVVIDVVDITDHPVAEHIQTAFANAASQLTAEELLGEPGFVTFVSGLDETDFTAINYIAGPPTVTGTCK